MYFAAFIVTVCILWPTPICHCLVTLCSVSQSLISFISGFICDLLQNSRCANPVPKGPFCMHELLWGKPCLSAHPSSKLFCLMTEWLPWGTCSAKNCDRECVWPCGSPFTYQQECKGCGISWIRSSERTSPRAENCRANGVFLFKSRVQNK